MRQILSASALLLLASCATASKPSAVPIPEFRPANVPASLTLPCKRPVALPESDLDTEQTVTLWAEDRSALSDCGLRHKALAESVKAIEGQGR